MSPREPVEVAATYLDALRKYAWPSAAELISDVVVRIGPYGDTYTSEVSYLTFLSDLLTTLSSSSMTVERVASFGRTVLVELTETVEMNGEPVETPEALVFDLNEHDRIHRVGISTCRLQKHPSMVPEGFPPVLYPGIVSDNRNDTATDLDVTIFHNPSCSNSRGAMSILAERSVDPIVIEYLDSPPSRGTLEMILDKLVDPISALVRTTDKRFIELGLDPKAFTGPGEIIELLLAHPELMQRPIAVKGDRAIIARPSEKIAFLLD